MKRKKKKNQSKHIVKPLGKGVSLSFPDPSMSDSPHGSNPFLLLISRTEVEACDTSRLLSFLKPDPNNPLVSIGPGGIAFSVHGYDDDPRELMMIPEFQAFARKMRENPPCWLYFAHPESAWINTMLVAGSPECIFDESGDGPLRVHINDQEAQAFMKVQLKEYTRICTLMKIDPDVVIHHLEHSSSVAVPENAPHEPKF